MTDPSEDIVARLRGEADALDRIHIPGGTSSKLHREAAEEIERLRAQAVEYRRALHCVREGDADTAAGLIAIAERIAP